MPPMDGEGTPSPPSNPSRKWAEHVRRAVSFFLLFVVVISSAQFYYQGYLDLPHIFSRSLAASLALTAFFFIKEKTEHLIPYPLLYFTALLLFSYLLLTGHPYALSTVEWLFGKGTLLSLSPAPEPGGPIHVEVENRDLAVAIHEEVNRARAEEGLPPYEWDEQLAAIAYLYAKKMAEEEFFSHYDEGRGPLDRYEEARYHCEKAANLIYAGENLFRGSLGEDMPSLIVESWLSSPSHRKNILSRAFEREGIGVYIKDDVIYVVENFC